MIKSFYTIKQKSKTLGLCYDDRHYVVGFKNVTIARSVQYSLHPEAQLSLWKMPLQDPNGMLMIPKYIGSAADPMNDGVFHLDQLSSGEFLKYPSKMVGIIVPLDLVEENDEHFVFDSFIVDPFFDPMLFRI